LFGSLQKGGDVLVDIAPGVDPEAPAQSRDTSCGACTGSFVFRYTALEQRTRHAEPALV